MLVQKKHVDNMAAGTQKNQNKSLKLWVKVMVSHFIALVNLIPVTKQTYAFQNVIQN